MRADTKALLKVFGYSLVLVVVVMGVLAAGTAVGWLKPEIAAYLALGCVVVGALVIGRRLGPALLLPQPRQDKRPQPPEDEPI